jgi:hypothetical protein
LRIQGKREREGRKERVRKYTIKIYTQHLVLFLGMLKDGNKAEPIMNMPVHLAALSAVHGTTACQHKGAKFNCQFLNIKLKVKYWHKYFEVTYNERNGSNF